MFPSLGTPWMPMDEGKARYLTQWEQLDQGMQFTATKKFLTVIPIVLFFLARYAYALASDQGYILSIDANVSLDPYFVNCPAEIPFQPHFLFFFPPHLFSVFSPSTMRTTLYLTHSPCFSSFCPKCRNFTEFVSSESTNTES